MDWQQFLTDHQINYVTRGPNVSHGNIAIKCPFCSDDPSEHLVISLQDKGWFCWRDRTHSGVSPVRLIATLIGCSYDTARKLAGFNTFVPEDLLARVQASLNTVDEPIEDRTLTLPKEFKPLWRSRSINAAFVGYMHRRGFTDHRRLEYYGLHYATMGPFRYRIIFPVEYHNRLMTWTGRTIDNRVDLRYKALSHNPEQTEGLDPAVAPISHFLLWYDKLKRADAHTLVLTEGPFDALRIDMLGRNHGIRATCFFTASPSEQQVSLLHELTPRYRKRYLLLDRNTTATGLRIVYQLSSLGVLQLHLPTNVKDPGEISEHDFHKIFLEGSTGRANIR